MADSTPRPFRWLGELGDGVLKIVRADGTIRVIPPHMPGVIEHGCIVKSPENLAALGAERIAELVRLGRAEYIRGGERAIEALAGVLRPDAKPPENPEERSVLDVSVNIQEAEAVAQKAQDFHNAAAVNAKPVRNADGSLVNRNDLHGPLGAIGG